MNLKEKLARVVREVESITGHVDEDVAVRHAALDAVGVFIEAERSRLVGEAKAAVDAFLGVVKKEE